MHNGLALHAVEGMIGGALGTLFLRRGTKIPVRAVQPSEGVNDAEPAAIKTRAERSLVTRSVPWLLGLAWGGLIGTVAHRLGARRLGWVLTAGIGGGAAAFLVDTAIERVSGTRPMDAPEGVGPSLLAHLGYGLVATLPILAVEAVRARRRRQTLLGKLSSVFAPLARAIPLGR